MSPFRACAFALLAATGCGGDPSPTLEVIDASPRALDPSRDDADDLLISVRYEDEDGDLGGGHIEVVDCRAAGLVTTLSLPAIASPEAVEQGASIEGQLELLVADVGFAKAKSPPASCRDLGVGEPSVEGQAFCVFAIDAAGNRSEGDCTPPVLVAEAP